MASSNWMDEIAEPSDAPKGVWMDEVPPPREVTIVPASEPGALAFDVTQGGNDPYWNKPQKVAIGALHGLGKIGDTALNMLDVPAGMIENKLLGTPVDQTLAARDRAYRDRGHERYQEQLGNSNYALGGDIAAEAVSSLPFLLAGGGAVAQLPKVGEALTAAREGGKLARLGYNAITGAGAGGAQAALVSGGNEGPLGEQIGTGAMMGAVVNPVLGPVANLLMRGARAAGPAIMRGMDSMLGRTPQAAVTPPVPPAAQAVVNQVAANDLKINPAQLPPEVVSNAAAEATAGASPEAVARRMNIEALGGQPLAGMVSRDPIAWGNERNMAKRPEGAKIAEAYAHNNQVARGHLARVMDESGGVINDVHEAGESIINSVRAKFGELQGDISRAYADVEAAIGPDPVVSPSRLRDTMLPLSDETAAEPMTRAITSRLRRLGAIDGDGNWAQNLSLKQAEELRKFIANEGEGSAAAGRAARQLQMALDDDVFTSTGSDAFGQARALARDRFAEIESSKINQAIFDEKATPSTLFNRFIVGTGAEPADLIALRDSLTSGNNLQMQRGTQTWNDLRQQTARYILDEATNAGGNAQAMAEGNVTYPGLRKALAKIGPQRLRVLFGDEGAQRYQNLLRFVSDTTHEPKGSTSNFSNSAIVGEDRARQLLAQFNPGLANSLMSLAHGHAAPMALTLANRMATTSADRTAAAAVRQQVEGALLGPGVTATRAPAAAAVPPNMLQQLMQNPARNTLITPLSSYSNERE